MALVNFDDDTAKRVARLSITALENNRTEIIKMLHSELGNPPADAMNNIEIKKPKRRRRSSAQLTAPKVTKRKFLKPPTLEYHDSIRKKLGINQLRDLILTLMIDRLDNAKWVRITNKHAIKNVVVVFTPGLVPSDFGHDNFLEQYLPQPIKESCKLPFFKTCFDSVIPIQTPGTKDSIYSPYSTLTQVKLNKSEKKTIETEDLKHKIFVPDLLLTTDELLHHQYPIHPLCSGLDESAREKFPLKEGWVETKIFEHEGSKTFALDCEMCLSKNGKELTRISLVDFNNKVIMDEFVKPSEEIVDYVTQYSGITEEILKNVTKTLADIQEQFLALVSADDVLIGHSLESDLNVMQLRHPKIIDTALIYEHPRGPPAKPSLKWLMKTYLEKDIQSGTEGHSSVEDSQLCMELVKLKILKGRRFGTNFHERPIYEKVFEVGPTNLTPKSSAVVDYSSGSRHQIDPECEKRIQCRDDNEIIEQVIANVATTNLVVARLRELETTRGFGFGHFDTLSAGKPAISVDEALKSLDNRLEKIYNSLPTNSLLIVLSGIGDPTKMLLLQGKRRKFHEEFSTMNWSEVQTMWDSKNLKELEEATNIARDGVALILLKTTESELILNIEESAVDEDSN